MGQNTIGNIMKSMQHKQEINEPQHEKNSRIQTKEIRATA
jgi:hypothetical protein